MAAVPPYDPNFTMASRPIMITIPDDLEHDPSASAAIVAAYLISSARLAFELDSEYTEYSAQFLVDKRFGVKLTVKDCLQFALSNGISKAGNWTHFGSVLMPPSSFKPALISTKGDVVETKDMEKVREWLKDQPVGAKLHVFSPQIDLVGDGIYCGTSGEPTGYVGLRDVVIVRIEKIMGKSIAIVKLWYKRKFTYVKVALSRMFVRSSTKPDGSQSSEATCYLVDFVTPRLSIDQETSSK